MEHIFPPVTLDDRRHPWWSVNVNLPPEIDQEIRRYVEEDELTSWTLMIHGALYIYRTLFWTREQLRAELESMIEEGCRSAEQDEGREATPAFWEEFRQKAERDAERLDQLQAEGKVRESDIVREWDECKRIFVSLALKETTQSTIVRKLSAQARNSRAKRALWEYDSIHRSLYLLNYIDCPPLRQHVQKAMNRGENYHQLRRAISHAGFGKLRFKTEYEQELWAECSRLMANCIIFYNASILSRLLEHQERIGDMQGADATKKVSPIAWQHINLQGRFEFLKQPDPPNMDAIIRELTEMPVERDATLAA